MRLLRCYVYRFGKLKDFSVEFDGELNTFYHENGWGKSTLATFIKSMFYGLNSQKRSVDKNERKKYMPWGSTDKFGGSIEFIRNDKHFKIERFFGLKESDDTVKLTDMTTGKVYTEQENLGGRIFGIDEDGFLSTVYLSQQDFEIESNATITNKYNQKYGGVDDGNAFNNAIDQLDKKIKELKRVGDKGIIPDKNNEIKDITNQLEKISLSEGVLSRLKDEVQQLETEKNRLENEGRVLTLAQEKSSKTRELLVKRNNYLEETSKLEDCEKELSQVIKCLNGNVCDKEELDRQFNRCTSLESRNQTKRSIELDIESLEGQVKVEKQKKEIPTKIILAFAISVVLIAIGGITLSSILALGIASFALGVIALGVGVYFVFSNKSEPKFNDNALLNMIDTKRQNLLEINRVISIETERLNSFLYKFNRHNVDAYSALDEIRELSNKYENLISQITELKKRVALKESDVDFKEFIKDDVEPYGSLDVLRGEISRNRSEFERVTKELFSKQADLKRYSEFLENATILEEKRDIFKEELEEATLKFDLLKSTKEFLIQADENLKIKYREPLEDSLNKYVNLLSGSETFRGADIDIDFKISVNENSGAKEVAYYSQGYKNLFDICRRFALIDVLFDKEKPFIILDDPFCNLDEDKILSSIKLVKELAKEYQIIYFVCHDSRAV